MQRHIEGMDNEGRKGVLKIKIEIQNNFFLILAIATVIPNSPTPHTRPQGY